MNVNSDILNKLKNIKLLALDVDGVLTDGCINMGDQGELFKSFNAKDGLGISAALRNGLQVAIITGRRSQIIHNRAKELGIELLSEGVKDKYMELLQLQERLGIHFEDTAYIGDDLNDLPAFKAAAVAFTPADGCEDVKAEAQIVLGCVGGRGAVREAIEMIFKAQNKWDTVVAGYKQSKPAQDKQ